MGLSNWERTHKVIWSIHHLTNLSNELKEYEHDYFDGNQNPYLQLRDQLQELWPVLIADKGNGGFWLFGSDENVEADKETLWSMALADKIMYCEPSEEVFGRTKRNPDDYIYDCLGEQFGVERLLTGRNVAVYKIYQFLQQIQYATNRYDDSLAKQYSEINRLVAKALGTIFYIFNESDQFTIAWLRNEIAEILIGKTFLVKKTEADPIQTYINKHHEHHTIKSYAPKGNDIADLKKILADLTVDHSLKGRFRVLAKMVGEHAVKYKHIFKDFEALATELGIKLVVQKVKKAKEKSDYQESREWYRKNLLGVPC